MRLWNFFFGLAIGFALNGILHLVFSSEKLSKKLDKKSSNYKIKEDCESCLIFGIIYSVLSVILIIFGFIFKEIMK